MLGSFKKAIFRALCLCVDWGGGVNGRANSWRAFQFGYAEL